MHKTWIDLSMSIECIYCVTVTEAHTNIYITFKYCFDKPWADESGWIDSSLSDTFVQRPVSNNWIR